MTLSVVVCALVSLGAFLLFSGDGPKSNDERAVADLPTPNLLHFDSDGTVFRVSFNREEFPIVPTSVASAKDRLSIDPVSYAALSRLKKLSRLSLANCDVKCLGVAWAINGNLKSLDLYNASIDEDELVSLVGNNCLAELMIDADRLSTKVVDGLSATKIRMIVIYNRRLLTKESRNRLRDINCEVRYSDRFSVD